MPKLGTKSFTSNGTRDGDAFAPSDGIRFTLVCTPDQPGTCQPFVYHTELGPSTAVAVEDSTGTPIAPVAGSANEPNIFPIEGAFGGSGLAFFLRYVNTNANAGTARYTVGVG